MEFGFRNLAIVTYNNERVKLPKDFVELYKNMLKFSLTFGDLFSLETR